MASENTKAIEAIVMVAEQPVPPQLLAQLLELKLDEVEAILHELMASYEVEDRGFILTKVAGGYRYQSHPDMAVYVERFVLEGQTARLSAAALETLAIIAYKQPISRAQVAAVRGVNVDGVVRTLEQRGYIAEVGKDPGPGNPTLFGTTDVFLERLGINSVADLPPIAAFVPGPDIVEQLEQGLRAEIDSDLAAELAADAQAAGEHAAIDPQIDDAVDPELVDAGDDGLVDAELDGADNAVLDGADNAVLDGAVDAVLDGAVDAVLDGAVDAELDDAVDAPEAADAGDDDDRRESEAEAVPTDAIDVEAPTTVEDLLVEDLTVDADPVADVLVEDLPVGADADDPLVEDLPVGDDDAEHRPHDDGPPDQSAADVPVDGPVDSAPADDAVAQDDNEGPTEAVLGEHGGAADGRSPVPPRPAADAGTRATDPRVFVTGGGGVAPADDPKGAPADEVVEADVPPLARDAANDADRA